MISILLFSLLTQAEPFSCKGETEAFVMPTFKNWTLEKPWSPSLGICTFYLPKNKTLEATPAYLYVRLAPFFGDKKLTPQKQLQQIISADETNLRLNSPVLTRSSLGQLRAQAPWTWTLVQFSNGPKNQEWQTIGYAILENQLFVVALAAKDQSALKENYSAWLDFLKETSQKNTKGSQSLKPSPASMPPPLKKPFSKPLKNKKPRSKKSGSHH